MSTDKIRIKSEKTGKEQDMTRDQFKQLEAVVGIGKHEVIKENTTPPEARAARERGASKDRPATGALGTTTGADDAAASTASGTGTESVK